MIKRATALAATLALTAPAVAHAGFKEHVKVLWQHTGEAGKYYAWGVAPLKDIDHDGADDVIAGEVGLPGSDDPGAAYVQSGRTGRILHKFVGKPGDQNGFAITDAGDIDRDGVHDVLSGAPRQFGDTEGHATSSPAATAHCCTRSPARRPATGSAPPSRAPTSTATAATTS